MILGIVRALAITIFMYLSWRNLRDNYKEEDLIKFLWLSVIFFLLGGRLGYGLINWGVWNNNIMDWFLFWRNPGISYVVGVMFMIGSMIFFSVKNSWKALQLMEDIVNYVMLFVGLLLMDEFIRSKWDLKTGLIVAALLVTGIVGNVMRKKYRSFFWYGSGKKGFVFYFNIFLLSLLMAVISLVLKENIIFLVVYLVVSLMALISLMILGDVFEPLLVSQKRRKNNG